MEAPTLNQIGILKLTSAIDTTHAEKLIKKILDFSENKSITGVMLLIDCHGGTGAAELIARELERLALRKPIVALIINSCYSAGYLVAASANYIIAPAAAGIGSIGVLRKIKRISNINEVAQNGLHADVSYDVVYAGTYKIDTDSIAPHLDDEMRTYHQQLCNELYHLFIERVALRRNLKIEDARDWADGKEFSGKSALSMGLIDQIGGYSDAVEKLKILMRDRGTYKEGTLQFIE